MGSRYDDELWARVPDDAGPPPPQLARFVRELPWVHDALDLGCGDGRLTAELRAERVTATDVSALALARARRRLGRDVRFLELAPDAPLPLEDSAFDLVLCAETLEHVRDLQLLLSEARRVLRPRGALALTTPGHGRSAALRALVLGWDRVLDPLSPHIRHLGKAGLRRLLEEMGFELASLRRERGTLLAIARR